MLKNLILFGAIVSGIMFLITVSTWSLLVYRNATALILYPVTLLHSLVLGDFFFFRFWRFLRVFYVNNHIICKQRQSVSSWPICLSCNYFSCLIAVELPVPCWIREQEQASLPSSWSGEKHSAQPWNIMLAGGSLDAFYQVEIFSLLS